MFIECRTFLSLFGLFCFYFCVVFSAKCREEDDSYVGEYFDAYRRNRIEDVTVRQYTGKTLCEYREANLNKVLNLLNSRVFNKNRTTVFYVHGFTENPLRPGARAISRAYLRRNDTNLLVLNWHNMAFWPYFYNAIPNCKTIADEVAKMMIKSYIGGHLQLNTLHVIGHSLGGHLGGMIGRRLKHYGYELPRLTVLDAVGIGFNMPPVFGLYFKRDDAKFVDVIHTNAGLYGIMWNLGTIDFWPNGGVLQPGCLESFKITTAYLDQYCSHRRSWEFWVESLENPTAFRASKTFCVNGDKRNLTCDLKNDDIPVYMGINVDQRLSGVYYLVTNSSSPYGKGDKGVCGCFD